MSEKTAKDWKKFKEESLVQDGQEVDAEMAMEREEDEAIINNALDHPSYLALEEKLTLAEQQGHDNWEKAVRAMAESKNIQDRADRAIANAHRYGQEKLITSLLPVVDSLEQALQIANQQADTGMLEGLELTMKQLLDVLKKHDVQQLDPQGAMFDPQQHEAMSIQESAEAPHNSVLAVYQKGYSLNDRVIRPARVIVAKTKQ